MNPVSCDFLSESFNTSLSVTFFHVDPSITFPDSMKLYSNMNVSRR